MLSFLAPAFLRRLDKRLVVSNPLLWVSKIHFVVYYTILLWILTSLIALIIPVNLTKLVSNGVYYTFFTIISVVLLCVWIYRNAIFNIESDYGNRKVTDEYKVFFINFFCVFLLFSYAYPFTVIYNARIANTVSTEELISDINALNVGEPFFARNYYDYIEVQERSDTVATDSIPENNYYTYTYKYNINEYRSWDKFTPYSLQKDSLNVPGLKSISEQQYTFNRLRKNDSEALQAIQNYISVLKKYDINFTDEASFILSRYKSLCKEPISNDNEQFNSFPYYYDIYNIENIIRNVSDAKYMQIFVFTWEFNLAVFYFVFYITLFFILFKTVRWQQFLITIVAFILIPILVFIFSMLISMGGNDFESISMTAFLLIYLVAVGFSISFFVHPKKYSAFKSICMQIVYICTPVFFLYLVFYLDENTSLFWRNYYYGDFIAPASEAITSKAGMEQLMYEEQYNYYRELFKNVIWGSMAFGIFFHVSFFMVFMKEQFIKMKALPKNS